MPLGVGGSTPFSMNTNHPTAYNHSFRDTVGYDPKKQSRIKCTYCGCWARKGELCYQCKQPTGPLVLPRRNGYRVEPLVGGGRYADDHNNNNNSDFYRNEGSSAMFSPRQMERLRTTSGNGGDIFAEGNSSRTSPQRRVIGGSPARTTSPSRNASGGGINGGVSKRFYVPASPQTNAEVFAHQLKNHVAAQQEIDAVAREQSKMKESRDHGSPHYGGDDDDDDFVYYNHNNNSASQRTQKTNLSSVSAIAREQQQQNFSGSSAHNYSGSSSARRPQVAGAVTVTSSHKGVTGGYFYHDEQTAIGHKFREESAFDPSKQTKVKCKYCGCWAKKGAACSLCRTVNKF